MLHELSKRKVLSIFKFSKIMLSIYIFWIYLWIFQTKYSLNYVLNIFFHFTIWQTLILLKRECSWLLKKYTWPSSPAVDRYCTQCTACTCLIHLIIVKFCGKAWTFFHLFKTVKYFRLVINLFRLYPSVSD